VIDLTHYSIEKTESFNKKENHSLTHSLPGAATDAGSWPTQEAASNHLWPWPSSS